MPRPRLICFDLGGVLIRLRTSWGDCCRAAGLDRDGPGREISWTNGFEDHSLRDWLEPVWDDYTAYQTGRIDGLAFAAAMREAHYTNLNDEEIVAVYQAQLHSSYPGLDRIIDDLHGAGLLPACLSNTNAEHWADMHLYPAVGMLGHRFASHEIGFRKPDAAVFRHVERELDLPGEAILFFDDAPANIEAARNAGWLAEVIDPRRDTAPQVREHLVRHAILPLDAGQADRRP